MRAVGRKDLLEDTRFADNTQRIAYLPALVETLTETLKKRPTQEWFSLHDPSEVPAGPVLTLNQVYAQPQTQVRNMEIEIEHPIAGRVHAIGFSVTYSCTGYLAHPFKKDGFGPRLSFLW